MTQLEQVRECLEQAKAKGAWLSLAELADLLFAGEASLSAQIRNLRKAPHCRRIEKRKREDVDAPNGWVWEYRLAPGRFP